MKQKVITKVIKVNDIIKNKMIANITQAIILSK